MEWLTLFAEAAVATSPAIATFAYASNGRKRTRLALRAPLFWDGGQPVTLATLYTEFNSLGDLPGELRELLGGNGPVELADLERAVVLLQGNPAMARRLVLDMATNVILTGTMPQIGAPTGTQGVQATVSLLDRLTAQQEALGYFGFVASLNHEQPASNPALLPIEGLLPGGFPVGPPSDDDPGVAGGSGVFGVLQALGLGQGGGWLPGVIRAVEDLVRDRHVAKARSHYHQALGNLGKAISEALRRRTPAGEAVRRNVYSPLDAYRNLATRTGTILIPKQRLGHYVVPALEAALHAELRIALARATAIVMDKCANMERTLSGRNGQPLAGEVLYKHRHVLLAGVDPAAFPIVLVEEARQAYRLASQPEVAGRGATPEEPPERSSEKPIGAI